MAATTGPQVRRGSWGNVNSKQFLKNYDRSPITSPKHSPPQTPSMSRNNSTTSIDSFRSEPPWQSSSGRHYSNASVASSRTTRQDSTSSQVSNQSTDTGRKGSFMGGIFHKKTKEEKEKEKKNVQKIVLGSKYAAAVKTKMQLDPAYREFQDKHRRPSVKTAGVEGNPHSSHSLAALQEARHPHSGPPALHGALDLPGLQRIESRDEPESDDDAMDENERLRREWNSAPEHNLGEIPEVRSRPSSTRASPWTSPQHSRDTSLDRSSTRHSLVGKRGSHHGVSAAYGKDAITGRWTKKTTPPTMTPVHPHHEGIDPDLLAASLAERLNHAS